MKVGIVMQARMGSKRLPGKTTMNLCGKPLVHWVIERLGRIRTATCTVLAVPDTPADRVLAGFAAAAGVEYFAGPEEDVLTRYVQVADRFGLDHIVRATGDNPLVDPDEADRLIAFHLEHAFEYSENFTVLPKGVGLEVFSRDGLERCHRLSQEPHQREGVNDFILENPGRFRTGTLQRRPYRGGDWDLTVDTWEQFERMASLYRQLYRPGAIIPTVEALAWLEQREGCRV